MSLARGTTQKVDTKKNQYRQRLEAIAKDNLEVSVDKENANQVDFDALFQDNLPPKAIELGEYVASLKDKDDHGEEKTEIMVQKAHVMLGRVKNIVPAGEISIRMIVSDLLEKPKTEDTNK